MKAKLKETWEKTVVGKEVVVWCVHTWSLAGVK
jgi:hypothetical protein